MADLWWLCDEDRNSRGQLLYFWWWCYRNLWLRFLSALLQIFIPRSSHCRLLWTVEVSLSSSTSALVKITNYICNTVGKLLSNQEIDTKSFRNLCRIFSFSFSLQELKKWHVVLIPTFYFLPSIPNWDLLQMTPKPICRLLSPQPIVPPPLVIY